MYIYVLSQLDLKVKLENAAPPPNENKKQNNNAEVCGLYM